MPVEIRKQPTTQMRRNFQKTRVTAKNMNQSEKLFMEKRLRV